MTVQDGLEAVPRVAPGIATPSEARMPIERAINSPNPSQPRRRGGPAYMAAQSALLPRSRLCPTGSVTLETAPRYLVLPNVICVGGSWKVGRSVVAAGNWSAITAAPLSSCRD